MSEHGGDIYRNQVDIDFSVNTSPYGIPPMVRESILKSYLEVGRYPDPENEELRLALARGEHVKADQILCGNGASELIYASVRAILELCGRGSVGIFSPSFSEYKRAVCAVDKLIMIKEVLLKEEHDFLPSHADIDKITEGTKLIIIGHPNNPTGRLLPKEILDRLLAKATKKGIYVILDESFWDLTENCGQMDGYQEANIIRIKSFTKSMAIPGVRLGYLHSIDKEVLERIKSILPEWNVSVTATAAGIAAVSCMDKLREQMLHQATGLLAEQAYLHRELSRLGIKVFPTDTCFYLLKSDRDLYQDLLEKGILIRSCANFHGLGSKYFRIAIKTHKENQKLVLALKELYDMSHKHTVGSEEKGERDSWNKTRGNVTTKDDLLAVEPAAIERTSFAILSQELSGRGIHLDEEKAAIIKRCIHTTADFEYANTLVFSDHAVSVIKELIKGGASIVTDTNMALSGINKKELSKYGGQVYCFMADEEVAKLARERGCTRASISMEKASQLGEKLIFVIGNAPTALVSLCEMIDSGRFIPDFVIGLPVGFVNVEQSKEMMMERNIPFIVNRGRKGGSNVAAAICNAVLYELREEGNV